MGFFSQQITEPNYWHYAYPHQAQIQQAQFEGQIGAYTQYMNSLWKQWGDYASVVSQTTKGLQDSFDSTFGAGGSYAVFDDAPYKAAIDEAYSTQKANLRRTYDEQTENLAEETAETKKRTSADLSFRGLGNTTTRNQLSRKIQTESDEIQAKYDEAYSAQQQNINAQRTEWLSDLSQQKQAWNAERALQKKQAEDQLLSLTSGLQQNLLYAQPLQLNPGPQLQGDYLSNLVNMAQQAQNKDIVVGEEGGWGGLALTGLGAGIGALFGPTGMMVGAGLGGALGGGLETAFGAPGYQQQGMQSMISGLGTAAMAGFSPYAKWSWGSPSTAATTSSVLGGGDNPFMYMYGGPRMSSVPGAYSDMNVKI